MPPQPIRREPSGDFSIELDPSVLDMLEHMCAELEALLESDSPLLTRLFPPPYVYDEERNEGYAALATPELMDNRTAAIATLRETLRATSLTAEELMAWMRSINDMRLVLGTLLGIDNDHAMPDIAEDMADTYAVYEYLGYLLEVIVVPLNSTIEDLHGDDVGGSAN